MSHELAPRVGSYGSSPAGLKLAEHRRSASAGVASPLPMRRTVWPDDDSFGPQFLRKIVFGTLPYVFIMAAVLILVGVCPSLTSVLAGAAP